MNIYRRKLAAEIVQHLQSTHESDIDFVFNWLASEGYDDDASVTDLVMEFSESNVLPSQENTK